MYQRGADYDLEAAIHYNAPGFTLDEVEVSLAAVYGENDGSNYYWVLRLTDGTVGVLQGWQDYTGWDCGSAVLWTPTATPEEAAAAAHDNYRSDNFNAYDGFAGRPVREALAEQLRGVPPELSAYQETRARMGIAKTVSVTG